MSLKYSLQNNKLQGMDHEFSEDAWYAFHAGDINDQDDFYTFFHEWIENQVIYYSEINKIMDGNLEYCFDEHEVFGKPETQEQAAFAVVYDYLMVSIDTVTFAEMEEVLNEE